MKTEEVIILQRCPARTIVAFGTRNGNGTAANGGVHVKNGRKPTVI